MFGRAEGDVDNIIFGEGANYCYDYDNDPDCNNKYVIRRPQYLLEGEKSVGCGRRCKFCQYAATRSLIGGEYTGAGKGYNITEDIWSKFPIKTGNVTTALDGFSEETRSKIGKRVSDAKIIEKLERILSEINGIMRLKVFQIVGYPWETPESLENDILKFRDTLAKVRSCNGKSRIMMMVTVTPFSPEPLTEMEDCPANVDADWRSILLDDKYRCIYDSPHINNTFVLPQIPGSLLLLKRVAVNRGCSVESLIKLDKAKTIDEGYAIVGGIEKKGAGKRVSDHLCLE